MSAPMRAISLLQPWASAWMLGIKLNETRDWPIPPSAAGTIAVHASKAFKPADRAIFMTPTIFEAFEEHGITSSDLLPLGAILGTLVLSGCHPTEEMLASLTPRERAFGNYGPNRFAWQTMLNSRRRLATTIPCKGALGFWAVPDEVLVQLRRQLTP